MQKINFMKNVNLALVLFFILLLGCTSQTLSQPSKDKSLKEADNSENSDFKETARVINALYDDMLKIGDERYLTLRNQLDEFETLGIGKEQIEPLRLKLEDIRIMPMVNNSRNEGSNSNFDGLVNEINTISEKKTFLDPEHFSRIVAELDFFEAQGIDRKHIYELREKVKSFNIAGPAPINETKPNFRKDPELPLESEREQLPNCSGKTFSTFPVDLSSVYVISSLGAIGPPGHTFPTEHSFIHLHATGTSPKKYDVYAPADVYLTHVREASGLTKDPFDYTIYFALCKDIVGYYNHVKELSKEVKKILESEKCLDFNQQGVCAKNIFSRVDAGTALGKVGAIQGNFDFGLIDLSKTNFFANPDRYGTRSLHVRCPYEYFSEPRKQKLLSLIDREGPSKCGVVAQDIFGTLKGNWFYGDARADLSSDWNGHLSFVDVDPGTQIVSIGGTISEPKTISFTPKTSGISNIGFELVTPDGKIYCYSDGSSKVLVQLISDEDLRVEHKLGSCDSDESFQTPFEYKR